MFLKVAKITDGAAARLCARGVSHAIESAAYATDPQLRKLAGHTASCHLCGQQLRVVRLLPDT
jgi:hypothetical protein